MVAAPDRAMMAPIEKIARFIVTGDAKCLDAFADGEVVILENFAPHLFVGPAAVAEWATAMGEHAKHLTALAHSFGPAQDFASNDERAFFSLPTRWSGRANGAAFEEDGGWAFLLLRQMGEWRVQSYGWAVTRFSILNRGPRHGC